MNGAKQWCWYGAPVEEELLAPGVGRCDAVVGQFKQLGRRGRSRSCSERNDCCWKKNEESGGEELRGKSLFLACPRTDSCRTNEWMADIDQAKSDPDNLEYGD